MKSLIIVRIFFCLFAFNVKASEISSAHKLIAQEIPDRLEENRKIKEIYSLEVDDLVDDIRGQIILFRGKRSQELSFLRAEEAVMRSYLVRAPSSLAKSGQGRLAILSAAKDFYSVIIPEREKEEKLSFIEFLNLYTNKQELIEAIQQTDARVVNITTEF